MVKVSDYAPEMRIGVDRTRTVGLPLAGSRKDKSEFVRVAAWRQAPALHHLVFECAFA
jgi:hypothetical protein